MSGGLIATTHFFNSCKTSTAADSGSFDDDAELVKAGADFEAMGVKTYEVAAASGLLTDQAVINTAVAYMNDHKAHLATLNALLASFGFDEIDGTNAQPAAGVADVKNQTDVVSLALSVEFDAASFYFSGIVNEIQSIEARRVFANILPVETAHFVTYKSVLGYNPAIDGSFFEDLSSGL